MSVRTFGVAALLVALSGCGSATDAVTFHAPGNYKAEVSVGPFMQLWSGPNQSMLMLMALPSKLDLSKDIQNSPVSGAKVERNERITICDGQPAHYGEMEGTANIEVNASPPASHHKPESIEFIATNVNDKTYLAMYVRPLGSAPDAEAEAAIRNVCPRRTGS